MTQTVTTKSLYESDFLLWTQETVAKIRAKDFEHVDFENLIEEIEALGRSEKQDLESRLETLLAHLLKRLYVDMPDCFTAY
jgi:DNA-directed RNA polymerase delta subunit